MASNFAKISNGINFKGQASVPTSPSNGDVFYNSTTNTFSEYINGFWFDHASKSDVASASSLTSANFTATVVQSSFVKITGSTTGNIHGLTASASAKTVLLYNATSVIQVIKNQSATEGTAANRITNPAGADVTITAGSSALLVYDITAATWVLASVSGSGSGSGGKNYISTYLNNPGNGDFENGSTSGWSLSHSTLDANNKMPNQASGSWSSASGNLSFSAVNSSPLGGTYSGQVVSSAATTAGDMLVSSAFTIDLEDQNQVLAVQLAFKPTVNPSNGNFSGTIANSFSVAMYDVTNGTWIQVSNNYGLIQGARTTQFYGTFQTSLTGTQYRLAVYNMNATSGAITFLVDDFKVGPQQGFSASGFVAPTVQKFLSGSGTYITPTGPVPAFLRVRMVGGGGGGSSSADNNGGAGGATTFSGGSVSMSAGGGSGGSTNQNIGGGSATGGDINISGGNCTGDSASSGTGGNGGVSAFGGSGGGGVQGGAGAAAATNSGSGGGGGSSGTNAGSGGGAGAYCEKIISNPISSYSYAVGSAGTAGSGGGVAGGAGGSGMIIVEEYYSSALTNGGAAQVTAPTVQRFLSGSGTYLLPTGPAPIYIEVEAVGGGGGGGGSGPSAGAGGTGTGTTFGSTIIAAGGGSSGGTQGGGAGAGGTNTINTSSTIFKILDIPGGPGSNTKGNGGGASSIYDPGGAGGGSFLSPPAFNAGAFAGTNGIGPGGGGSGGGGGSSTIDPGLGGGGGGYVKVLITNPLSSYAYSVGAGGGTGGAGTGGQNGSTGGNGIIIVTEYYATGAAPLVPVKKAPTVQKFTSGSGTYLLPTGPVPLYIIVTVVGSGGSGAGSGNNDSGGGNSGNASTFGSSLLTGGAGAGGSTGYVGGAGGNFTVNSPAVDIGSSPGNNGTAGAPPLFGNFVNSIFQGGTGGSSGLGGGGAQGGEVGTGSAGITNSGGGGGGAGCAGFSSGYSGAGAGGGGGAKVRALIVNPLSSYSYAVGASVAGGTQGSGTSGAGGASGSGVIIVEEFYN